MSAARIIRKARGPAKSAPLENTLHIGDCLLTLEDLHETYGEFADLVYLDPPFNSDQNYNRVFRGRDSNWDKMKWRGGEAQAKKMDALESAAFHDAWKWTNDTKLDCENFIRANKGAAAGDFMFAMRHALTSSGGDGGNREMLAYLTYMVPRLAAIRGVMKPSASVYLHCDPTASHYLKLAMDAVFGRENFCNDVAWCYTGPGKVAHWFPRNHDTLLFYAKNKRRNVFNIEDIRVPYKSLSTQHRVGGNTGGIGGNLTDANVDAYRKRGKVPEDYWLEADGFTPVGRKEKERLGYPTQKPLALLRRIIQASSNRGGVVLDPFCGCGTTIAACHELGRKFVGVDVSRAAAQVIKTRMNKFYGRAGKVEGKDKSVMACYPAFRNLRVGVNIPTSGAEWARVFSGKKTAENEARLRDKAHAFQYEAIAAIPHAKQLEGERPKIAKKGRDGGIDGLLYLVNDYGVRDSIIISVKHHRTPNQNQVDELLRVVQQNNALMGLLITLVPPSPAMKAAAGVEQTAPIKRPDGKMRRYNRAAILTFDEVKDEKFREVLPYHLVVDPDSPDRLGVEKARKPRARG